MSKTTEPFSIFSNEKIDAIAKVFPKLANIINNIKKITNAGAGT